MRSLAEVYTVYIFRVFRYPNLYCCYGRILRCPTLAIKSPLPPTDTSYPIL